MSLPKISEAEYEVMKVIWKHAPISTNEVVERLADQCDWSPKTIHTLLKRLVDKKALTYEKDSRVFVYTPLIREEDYVSEQSASFLDRYYGGDLGAMVVALAGQGKLSDQEINALQAELEKMRGAGGK
jgi:BlaI family penicillinase repressor